MQIILCVIFSAFSLVFFYVFLFCSLFFFRWFTANILEKSMSLLEEPTRCRRVNSRRKNKSKGNIFQRLFAFVEDIYDPS